jgi:hypothetical protein
VSKLRIPFEEAIYDKRLFKKHFFGDGNKWRPLSFPQQTVLMAAYGLPLSKETDDRGWSRLDYFWAAQGYGTFDELGYLIKVEHPGPYVPREYREVWNIAGVRSGKSLLADIATSYEAVCGGHEEFVKEGTRAFCFQVAQDLRSAQKALVSIKAVLDGIPYINAPYFGAGNFKGRMMDDATKERIDLWNRISIRTMAPSIKAIRGYDSPCSVLDEIGVWPTDKDSANVDTEVYDQAFSRQAQFSHPKIFGLSSPWIMSGMLYDHYAAGTDGKKLFCNDCQKLDRQTRGLGCIDCENIREMYKDKLVFHLPTATYNNPLVKKAWFISKRNVNPQNFRRECLAEFLPAAASFLDPLHVDECVDRGKTVRPAIKPDGTKKFIPYYVAAIDPGFKRDTFGLAVGHADENGQVIVDYIDQFKPVRGQPVSPEWVLSQIAPILKEYGCYSAVTDQYNFPALSELALQKGFSITEMPFTGTSKNNIFGNIQTLVNLRKIRLLDHADTIHELKSLQRLITGSGAVQIGAPTGLHDDLAVVVALVAAQAVYLNPNISEPPKQETYQDIIDKQIAQRHRQLKLQEW